MKRTLLLLAAALLVWAGSAAAVTFKWGADGDAFSMDPYSFNEAFTLGFTSNIYDGLVSRGKDLKIEPGLAESWKMTSPTTWEFKLRKGVKFHDGSDFTAEDVKVSVARMQAIKGPNPTIIYVRRVKEVKIVDPHTVHMLTDGPAPTLPNDFIRLFIVSAKIAGSLMTPEAGNEAFNSGKAAIGTGPFKFSKWTPKDEFIVERNADYWQGASPWQRVVRKEIPNDAARVAQLKAGQVDMIVRVPATDVPSLERDPKLTVSKVDSVYVFNIDMDMRDEKKQVSAKDGSALAKNPFQDQRVREAFSLAIDRKALAEIAMEGLGKPVTQMVTPSIFGHDDSLPELKPDLDKAKKLMADAGYPNGFKVTFNFTNDRLPGDRAVGTSVAQMLARIGVDVVANGQPGATLFPARTRGDYSMVMSGWGTLTGEAHYTLSSLGHSNDAAKRMGTFNWRGYKNEKIDKALQDAAVEIDDGKRKALLQEAARIFMADLPCIPLVSVGSAWAMQKDKVKMLRVRVDEDTLAYDVAPVKTN
jgi:peptide/nickel transport system substrate-binding protein